MNSRIIKSLNELVGAGVISEETAEGIREYYQSKQENPSNTLIIVFSIIGALLVGLGIILIVAHNWDHLSRTIKTSLAILPMVTGQFLCGYVLLKKKRDQTAWREGGSAFLFLAVGACISMVSQIYNVQGTLSSFLLTWMLLCIPLVYAMKSSVASLLYIAGITYYAVERGYFEYPENTAFFYWPLLLLIIPHTYFLYRHRLGSNFFVFHNWMIPISLTIVLGTVADTAQDLMFVAYMSLFGIFYFVGEIFFSHEKKLFSNSYKLIGAAGTLCLLMALSFHWFWDELFTEGSVKDGIMSPEFLAAMLLSFTASALLYLSFTRKKDSDINPVEFSFLVFLISFFFIGPSYPFLAMALVNLLILYCGIYWIRNGAKLNHLGILNFGLLIIITLACCRFFDVYMSFVIRGLLFMSVGALFFATNYFLIQKRKKTIIN